MGKRDDILKATLELVSDEGLQSITFAKLFERANVGAGTFYNYFKNKEELVNALYENIQYQVDEAVLARYDETATVWMQFETFLHNLAAFAKTHRQEMWFIEHYATSPYISQELRTKILPAYQVFVQVVQAGQAQWTIREMNPTVCVEMVTGMLVAAVKGEFLGKYTLTTRQLQEIIDTCWRAIKM